MEKNISWIVVLLTSVKCYRNVVQCYCIGYNQFDTKKQEELEYLAYCSSTNSITIQKQPLELYSLLFNVAQVTLWEQTLDELEINSVQKSSSIFILYTSVYLSFSSAVIWATISSVTLSTGTILSPTFTTRKHKSQNIYHLHNKKERIWQIQWSPLKQTLKWGRPLYNGQTVRHRLIPYKSW